MLPGERFTLKKEKDIKLSILLTSLLSKIFQCIKAKTDTTDQLEHQDLLCKRILPVAELGHVSWKIIISLTSSRARTMKVKIFSHRTLKIGEKEDNISEMKIDMPLILSRRIAYNLKTRLLPQMGISGCTPAPLFPYSIGSLPFLVRNVWLDIFHYAELSVNSDHEKGAHELSFCFLCLSREKRGCREWLSQKYSRDYNIIIYRYNIISCTT